MSVKRIQKIDIDTAKFLYLNLFVHDPIHDYKGNDTRLTNVQHAFNKLEEYVKDAKKGKKTDSQKGGNGDKMDEDDADEDNDDDNAMDDNAMDDNGIAMTIVVIAMQWMTMQWIAMTIVVMKTNLYKKILKKYTKIYLKKLKKIKFYREPVLLRKKTIKVQIQQNKC